MLSTFVTLPAEFVAFTVKFDVPAVVGVPVIAPVVAFKIKPTGSVPFSTAHIIGVVPVAASLWLYALFTVPSGREAVVIVGGAVMTMLRVFVPFPAEFVALTEKLNVPIVVGVPEMTPVVSFKLRPAGSVRLEIDQVIGIEPVASSVWLYDCPTMPPGRAVVVTAGICVMTMLMFLVVFPTEFIDLIVKPNVPIVVGIPVIAPVVSFKFRPVGSVPLAIDHVIGVVPVAVSLWL